MKDLRVEFRTRNNVLWHAIFDTCDSVAEFCRRHDFRQQVVGGYLNLTRNPFGAQLSDSSPRLRPSAQCLCDVTGLGQDELFPEVLYSGLIPKDGAAEVESHRFLSLNAARHLALPSGLDEGLDAEGAKDMIAAALQTLSPREAVAVRMRFGLGDHQGEEHTLDDVANALGVGRERARQIEMKALRKLRHPMRSRALRPFIDMRHTASDYE